MQTAPRRTIIPQRLQRAVTASGQGLARLEPAGYSLLRIVFSGVLFSHSLPKALGTSHGSMADPMGGSIALIENSLGLPYAPLWAWAVMLLETAGALLLALGLGTRLLALAIAVEMLAISYALGPTWPWLDRGIEYPVLMGVLALYIATRGGGRHALEAHWGKAPKAQSAA